MTGSINGAIRQLEEQLGRSLQWAIYFFHVRHIFKNFHVTTKKPFSFSAIIRKELGGTVSKWHVFNLSQSPILNFLCCQITSSTRLVLTSIMSTEHVGLLFVGMTMKTCNFYQSGNYIISVGSHWLADYFANTFSDQSIKEFANLVRVLYQSLFPTTV